MYIENLKLSNFKNYTDAEVDLCDNINCFVGNNGAGKTNLLDAVYYLSFCKSYFTAIDTQNIRRDEPFFAIHGRYRHDDHEFVVSCVQKRGQSKQMRLDKKAYKSLAEHIGKVPLVIITPSDQSLIIGGSELRRKFVDGVISQTDREYLQHLMQYQKCVEQRNSLLRQFYDDRTFDEPSLQLWDDQLVIHGTRILMQRMAFVRDFIPIFQSYFSTIAGNEETPTLFYDSKLLPSQENGSEAAPSEQAVSDQFREQLHTARQRDKYMLHTTVGPHRDDVELLVDGLSVRRCGSQGQQKTFLLALKLAQFEYIYNVCGIKPILLLDDIFDKLDMLRVRQLVHLVGTDRFGQVLLSDTQPGRVQAIFDEMPNVEHRIFNVEKGNVSLEIEK